MYVIHGQGIGARFFSIIQRLTFEQKTTAPKVRLVPHTRDTNVERETSLRTDNYAQILMKGLNTTTHLLTMIR